MHTGIDSRRWLHGTPYIALIESVNDNMTKTANDKKQPQVSVVAPLLDEQDNLPALYEQITRSLTGRYEYEVILVDDGSTDGTWNKLAAIAARHPHLRLIRFRRNFGQTAAMSAGFHAARGDVVITLDADLQNDPADIPLLLARIREGYDVVSGWRKDRKDPFLNRRLPSMLANGLISRSPACRCTTTAARSRPTAARYRARCTSTARCTASSRPGQLGRGTDHRVRGQPSPRTAASPSTACRARSGWCSTC